MSSSADDGDDSIDELQSFQELPPVRSVRGAPSATALQHRPRMSIPLDTNDKTVDHEGVDGASEDSLQIDSKASLEIQLPPAKNIENYTWVSEESDDGYVDCVQSEVEDSGNISYHILYDDGGDDIVSALHYIRTTPPMNASSSAYHSSTTFIPSFNITSYQSSTPEI